MAQLSSLFGANALEPFAYFDKIWNDECILDGVQIITRPHQFNGHVLLQTPYFGSKLVFAGTETSVEFAGYMEGAVLSAQAATKAVLSGWSGFNAET